MRPSQVASEIWPESVPQTVFTHAFTVPEVANRLLLVGVAAAYGGPAGTLPVLPTSVTYNGVALTKPPGANVGLFNDKYSSSIWLLVAPDTGEHDIVVTLANSTASCVIIARVYGAVDQHSPNGTAVVATAFGDFSTIDINLAPGELGVDMLLVEGGSTLAADSAQFDVLDARAPQNPHGATSHKAGVGLTSMSWTHDIERTCYVAIPIRGLPTFPLTPQPVRGVYGGPQYGRPNAITLPFQPEPPVEPIIVDMPRIILTLWPHPMQGLLGLVEPDPDPDPEPEPPVHAQTVAYRERTGVAFRDKDTTVSFRERSAVGLSPA